MADQMPSQVWEVPGGVDLPQRLLNPIFSEVALAFGIGLADGFDWKGLGHGDEPH